MFAEHNQCTGGASEMAVPTCIKCGGHAFELALFTPIGASQKFEFIQCAACGVPVAAIGTSQIEALRSQIASIDDRLTRIAKSLAG
jgi:hypothetical protein